VLLWRSLRPQNLVIRKTLAKYALPGDFSRPSLPDGSPWQAARGIPMRQKNTKLPS